MSKLYDRLDRYVQHERIGVSNHRLLIVDDETAANAIGDTIASMRERVKRTKTLAARQIDWTSIGCTIGFIGNLLDAAKR